MFNNKRSKLINFFLLLLILFVLNELLFFQYDEKNSLIYKVQKRLKYRESIERGLSFYDNKSSVQKLEFDEYWLHTIISSKTNRNIAYPPVLLEKISRDPAKRIMNRADFTTDIKFERKKNIPQSGTQYNNSGYKLNAPYDSFLKTPVDDSFYKSLYCDLTGYDNEDFQILKSMERGDGGYFDTHYLVYLLILEKNKCYAKNLINPEIEKVIGQIIAAQKKDQYFSDLYAERIVVLYWAGKGNLVEDSWVDKVKNNPGPDPGWRDKGTYFSNAHTTGLALLALIYHQEGKSLQSFYP